MISKLFQQASDLFYQGQYAYAEAILLDVIKRDPVNERALMLLSICTQSIDKQIKFLKKVIEINPNNAAARASLREVEAKKKRIKRKVDKLEKERKTGNSGQASSQEFSTPSGDAPSDSEENGREKNETTNAYGPTRKKAPRRKQNIESDESGTDEEIKLEGQVDVDESPIDAADAKEENSAKHPSNKKQKPNRKPPQLTIPEPEHVKRLPEDDFFHGFREGIEPISRMETGMYGKNMVVSGISFPLFDGPPCLRIDNPQIDTECDICEFYAPQNCLLRLDTFLLEDINRFTGFRVDRTDTFARKRRIIVKTLYRELKTHGRPLHCTVIAKIMMERHPKFRLRKRNIYRYLSWHPELFEKVDDGVYRAR